MAACASAKVGTIPMLIWIPNTTELAVGNRVKFTPYENGELESGYVTKLEPILFIDKS